MKKIVGLILCCLMLVACGSETEKEEVPYETEYERIGTKIAYASPAKFLNLEEACNEADLVVRVQIKGLVYASEHDDGVGDFSIFLADVIKVFGGDKKLKGESICVTQASSKEVMKSGYPLFKAGDEYIFCLVNDETGTFENSEFCPNYRIINSEWGVIQIFVTENEEYVLNRGYRDFFKTFIDEKVDEDTRDWVLKKLYESDPVLDAYGKDIYEVYTLDVVYAILEEIYE